MGAGLCRAPVPRRLNPPLDLELGHLLRALLLLRHLLLRRQLALPPDGLLVPHHHRGLAALLVFVGGPAGLLLFLPSHKLELLPLDTGAVLPWNVMGLAKNALEETRGRRGVSKVVADAGVGKSGLVGRAGRLQWANRTGCPSEWFSQGVGVFWGASGGSAEGVRHTPSLITTRAVLEGGGGGKRVRNANRNECSRGRRLLHGQDIRKTQNRRDSGEQCLAVGGSWRLAVGGRWRLAQPFRLAFSRMQDHPGHCLLLTAPTAHTRTR